MAWDIGAYKFVTGTDVETRSSAAPFSESSIWNLPIPAAGPSYQAAALDAGTDAINWYDEPIGIIETKASDPLKSVFTKSADDYCNPALVTSTLAYQANLPNSFIVAAKRGKNGVYALVDTVARRIRESYLFQRCSAGSSAAGRYYPAYQNTPDEVSYELDGDGIPLRGMVVGSLMAGMGGVIRQGELLGSTPIGHALALLAPASVLFYDTTTFGFKWPARSANSFASTAYTGTDPEMLLGTLLSLSPAFDLTTLTTAPAKKIATALRDFGGYIVDSYETAKAWGLAMEVQGTSDALQVVKAELLANYGIHLDDYAAAGPYTNAATTNFKADLDLIFESVYQITNTSITNPKGDPTAPVVALVPPVTPTPPVTPPPVPTAWIPPVPTAGQFVAPGTTTTAPGIVGGAPAPTSVLPAGIDATFGDPRIIKVPVRSFDVAGVPGTTVYVRAKWRRTTDPLEESAYSNILAIHFAKINADDLDLADIENSGINIPPAIPEIGAIFKHEDFFEVRLRTSGHEGVFMAYQQFGPDDVSSAIQIKNLSNDTSIGIRRILIEGGLKDRAGFFAPDLDDAGLYSGGVLPLEGEIFSSTYGLPIVTGYAVCKKNGTVIQFGTADSKGNCPTAQEADDAGIPLAYRCKTIYSVVEMTFSGFDQQSTGAPTGDGPEIIVRVESRSSTIYNSAINRTELPMNMPGSLAVGYNGTLLYDADLHNIAKFVVEFTNGTIITRTPTDPGYILVEPKVTAAHPLEDFFVFVSKSPIPNALGQDSGRWEDAIDFGGTIPEGISLEIVSRSDRLIVGTFMGDVLEEDTIYYVRVGARRPERFNPEELLHYTYSQDLSEESSGAIGHPGTCLFVPPDPGASPWVGGIVSVDDLPDTGNVDGDMMPVKEDADGFPTIYEFTPTGWVQIVATIKALVLGILSAIDTLIADPGIGFRLSQKKLYIGIKDVYEGKSYAAAYAGDLAVTELVPTYRVDRDCTLQRVTANVKTAPTGADVTLDIKKNGNSLWTSSGDRPKVAASNTTGSITAFNTKTLAEGDVITFHITGVGSGNPGAGLTIQLDVQAAVRSVAPTTPADP